MLDQAQPIPAETPIQLTLPVAQVNTLLAALCEAPLPHRVSDPIIRAIRVQVQPQVWAQQLRYCVAGVEDGAQQSGPVHQAAHP